MHHSKNDYRQFLHFNLSIKSPKIRNYNTPRKSDLLLAQESNYSVIRQRGYSGVMSRLSLPY